MTAQDHQPIISFKDFSFRYKAQQQPTLKNISFDIYSGEKVLILGPSGSGKSTLAKCINGIIPNKNAGEITGTALINNRAITAVNIFERAQDVATILQDSNAQFVGLSVGEDIAFYLENRNTPVKKMHVAVENVAKFVGLEKQLNQILFNLSGGEKQRTTIAGSMHGEAPIMVFDEPLAALNPQMCDQVMHIIDRLNKEKNKTILIVEHRLEEVLQQAVDRVLVMNDGQIVLSGTPDEILASNKLPALGIQEPLYLNLIKQVYGSLATKQNIWNVDVLAVEPYIKQFKRYLNQESNYYRNKQDNIGAPIIKIRNGQFKYDQRTALILPNLDIYQGETISLIGKNGAGKSTLAKILTGMLKLQQGTITAFNKDYHNLTLQEIGHNIAYIMQDPDKMLIKDTVFAEVAFSLELQNLSSTEINERVTTILKLTDLYKMRTWPVTALSYGQKKRLTIAAVLVLEPKCIILDEPTAGQDYAHYQEIMTFVKKLNQKMQVTIILITHNMQLALEYTDRALVINQGKIVADKRPFEILTDPKLVSENGLALTSIYRLGLKMGLDAKKLVALSNNRK